MRIRSLKLKYMKVSPLTPLRIEGKRNIIADIPSRSFGSVPAWHWKTNNDFLTNFNTMFPLPQQNSWSLFNLSLDVFLRVVCILRMKDSTLEEWWWLPRIGTYIGGTAVSLCQVYGSGPILGGYPIRTKSPNAYHLRRLCQSWSLW